MWHHDLTSPRENGDFCCLFFVYWSHVKKCQESQVYWNVVKPDWNSTWKVMTNQPFGKAAWGPRYSTFPNRSWEFPQKRKPMCNWKARTENKNRPFLRNFWVCCGDRVLLIWKKQECLNIRGPMSLTNCFFRVLLIWKKSSPLFVCNSCPRWPRKNQSQQLAVIRLTYRFDLWCAAARYWHSSDIACIAYPTYYILLLSMYSDMSVRFYLDAIKSCQHPCICHM